MARDFLCASGNWQLSKRSLSPDARSMAVISANLVYQFLSFCAMPTYSHIEHEEKQVFH